MHVSMIPSHLHINTTHFQTPKYSFQKYKSEVTSYSYAKQPTSWSHELNVTNELVTCNLILSHLSIPQKQFLRYQILTYL